MNLRVGTAAWTIPREFSSYFPEEGSQLERYSKVFNCVEINSSFNKIHRPGTYEKWASVTPPDFEFSIKLHRSFTHESDLKPSFLRLRENLRDIKYLGDKWKVLLVQFPGKLEFSEKHTLRFYEGLRKNFDGAIVLEPRNLTWISPASRKLMKEFGISKVLADPERCPTKNKTLMTASGIVYFRLHGSPVIYRSKYSETYIRNLRKELVRYPKAWCIFDNTTFGAATGNAYDTLSA